MAGCKRCVLKGGNREKEKEEKRKGKRRKKWGSKSVFFFCFFLYKSVRMFFHMRSGHFSNILGKLYLDLVNHIRFCLRSKF